METQLQDVVKVPMYPLFPVRQDEKWLSCLIFGLLGGRKIYSLRLDYGSSSELVEYNDSVFCGYDGMAAVEGGA
jgi:hypothetical protein